MVRGAIMAQELFLGSDMQGALVLSVNEALQFAQFPIKSFNFQL
jgi:hypothetical protein